MPMSNSNHLPKFRLPKPSYEVLGFNIWILSITWCQSESSSPRNSECGWHPLLHVLDWLSPEHWRSLDVCPRCFVLWSFTTRFFECWPLYICRAYFTPTTSSMEAALCLVRHFVKSRPGISWFQVSNHAIRTWVSCFKKILSIQSYLFLGLLEKMTTDFVA